MPTQERPDEMVGILSSDFQKRYEPNFAWKSACAAHMALPGLRGFWPMSAFDSGGDAYDQSGHNHILTYGGAPTYNYDNLAPYIGFGGSPDRLYRPDEADLDITGTEPYVGAGAKGLTVGGWFYINATTGADSLMSKLALPNDISFELQVDQTLANDIIFLCSSTGVAGTTAWVYNPLYVQQTWLHCVGRFIPSTQVDVWVNGVYTTQATANASVFNGAADLNIGAYGAGAGGWLDGRASMCFLCAAALSDAQILALFEQTRAMYGA